MMPFVVAIFNHPQNGVAAPAGYGITTRVRPEWHVGNLTFQAGVPYRPIASLTGGGDMVLKQWRGTFAPVIVEQQAPLSSITGGGMLPGRPYFMQPLNGANSSGNSGSGAA